MRINPRHNCSISYHLRLGTWLRTAFFVVPSFLPGLAHAGPEGGVVAHGNADITQAGTHTTITQSSERAVLDWRKFNVGAQESVGFVQPSASSVAVNRIHDLDPSKIDGSLSANGHVVLINPNGVVFGAGSKVDVQGLVASTAAPTEQDAKAWAAGQRRDLPLSQAGRADGLILNAGTITAGEAGLVGFVAPNVVNAGVIAAKSGTVHLASGDTATLDLQGDGLVSVAVSDATTRQLAANHGLIQADGGTVMLSAAAAKHVVNSTINMDGVIQARSLENKNGRILLQAEGSNAVAGNDPALKGQKSGASTVLVSGVLDASGTAAGQKGGGITATGDLITLTSAAKIDASGPSGGGDVRIGGDTQGQGSIPTAHTLTMERGATIHADARREGDGGRVILWSDDKTTFSGSISARGAQGGTGGFLETSGHRSLSTLGGQVDLRDAQGGAGTWLLDPANITIYNRTGSGDQTNTYTTAQLETMSTSASVSLSATNNITLDLTGDTLNFATAGRALTLAAGNQILTASIGTLTTNGGAITLTGTNGVVLSNVLTLNAGSAAIALTSTNSAITASAALTFGSDTTITAGTGTITTAAIAMASGKNLTLTADDMTLGGNISGTGILTMQAYTSNRFMDLGVSVAGELSLDNVEIGNIVNGWSEIDLGGVSSTGYVNFYTSTWNDPIVARAYYKNVSGTLTGQDNASITFAGSGRAQFQTGGNITTTGNVINLVNGPVFYAGAGNSNTVTSNGGAITMGNMTNGGYPAFQNFTVNSGGGNITLTNGIGSSGSTGNIILNAGSGALSITGTVNGGYNITGNAGSLLFSGGAWGGSTAIGSVSLTSANTSFTAPNIATTGNVTLNAGTGTITTGTIATGAGNLTLTADDLAIGGNLSGTGALTLKPSSAARNICVNYSGGGCAGANFGLSTVEVAYLSDGWSSITLGSTAGTSSISIGASTWYDPLITKVTGGSVFTSIYGSLVGTGNASFTFGTTSLGAGVSVTTAGQAVSFFGNLDAGGGGSSVITNGGNFWLNNALLSLGGSGLTISTSGGSLHVGGVTATGATGQNLILNAGSGAMDFGNNVNTLDNVTLTAGSLAFNGAWGATTQLGTVAITSANTSYTLPNLTATGNVTLNAGTGTITTGTIATGAGNLTLTADDLVIGGSLSGTGTLMLRPSSTSRSIRINNDPGGPSAFYLDPTELGYLSNGWAGITIGRTDAATGTDIGTSVWLDPLTINGYGIRTYGSVTGTDNASLNFVVSGGANGKRLENRSDVISSTAAITMSGPIWIEGTSAQVIQSTGGAINLSGNFYLDPGTSLALTTTNQAIGINGPIANRTTSMSGYALSITAGSGIVTFGGTVDTDANLSANGGSLLFNGAWGGTKALGNVTLTSANTNFTLPSLTATGNVTLNAGTGTITTGTIATGAGSLTLTADGLSLGGAISGTGALLVQPYTASRAFNINNGTAGLYLTSAQLAYLQSGWGSLTFGNSSDTGVLSIGANNWLSSVNFLNGSGNTNFTGGTSTLAANASLSATSASGDINLTSAVTTITASGTGALTLAAGNNLNAINNATNLTASGTGAITLRANNGLIINYGTLLTQGGAITLNSDRDASGAGSIYIDYLSNLSSNGGNITLGGGNNPLTGYAFGISGNGSTSGVNIANSGGPAGSVINAGGGNILLNGQGWGNASCAGACNGVSVSGSNLLTSGAGTITINAIGGGTTSNTTNDGGFYLFDRGGSSLIQAQNGDITINARTTETSFSNAKSTLGMSYATGIQTTGTGNITLNAINNGSAIGQWRLGSGSITSGGNFTYVGDSLDTTYNYGAISAAGNIIIRPYTAGATVGVGTGPGALSITDAWLANFTFGTNLWLGGYGNPGDAGYISNAGNLTINETRSFAKNINFLSAGNILSSGTGTITTTSVGSILLAALGDINLSSAQNFTASGTGSITERANGNIIHSGGGVDTTNGGAITLNADRDGDSNGAIALSAGSNLTSNGGAITLGGGSNPLTGYAVGNATLAQGIALTGIVVNAGNNGVVALTGRGYAMGTGNAAITGQHGIMLNTSTIQTAGIGNIGLTGVGGGTGAGSGLGLYLYNGSTITMVDGGASLIGTGAGGASSSNNYGVQFSSFGTNKIIASGNAVVNVTGTGGAGFSSDGISTGSNALNGIFSTSGDITLTSINANLSLNGTIGGASATGRINLISNYLNFGTPTIQTTGDIVIRPYGAGITVGVGSGTGTLSVTDAILGTLNYGSNLWLGGYGNPGDVGYISNAGNLTINETRSFAKNINFLSAGNILSSGSGTVTTTGTGSVLFSALGDITLSTGQNFTASGSGSITERANGNISHNGSVVTSTGGAITLNADRDANGAGAISVASAIASNGGNITLGGGANPLLGYARGVGSTNSGYGVLVNSTSINAAGGNITLNGQGWSDSTCNNNCKGVYLQGGANISTIGSGNITISGIGGGIANSPYMAGVQMPSASISAVNGNINITSTAISSNSGYSSGGGVIQTTGTGNITFTVYGLNGYSAAIDGYGATTVNSGGNLTFVADAFSSGFASFFTNSAAGDIVLRPYTAGTSVGIGSGAGTLSITDALLSKFTWGGTLWLGGDGAINNAGTLTLNTALPSFAGNVNVQSGADVVFDEHGNTIALASNKSFSATAANNVSNSSTGAITTAGTGSISLTANSGSGSMNISNAALNLTANGSGSIGMYAKNAVGFGAGSVATTHGGSIILNSDTNGDGYGSANLQNGASLNSNGGAITIGGGANPLTGYAWGYTNVGGVNVYGIINAAGGDITLNGKGWGNASITTSRGVFISGATISTSGSGKITINAMGGGTAATTTNSSDGFALTSGSLSTQNGDIIINASSLEASTTPSAALKITGGSISTTGTGNILFTATNNGSALGRLITSGGSLNAGGNIGYVGDTLDASNYAATWSAASDIIIRPYSAGTTVGIGNGTGVLGVTDNWLSKFSYGNNLWLGGYGNLGDAGYVSNAGNLTIAETRSFAKNINFLSAGNILTSGSGTVTTTGAGNILLAALGDINFSTSQALVATGTGSITERANNSILHTDLGASLTSAGGAITLNADRDGNGAGGIRLQNNLISNGGNITLGGGSNPLTGYAVADSALATFGGTYLSAATINAGGGNIVINGQGYANASCGNSCWGAKFGSAIVQTNGFGTISVNAIGGGISSTNFDSALRSQGATFRTVNGDINFSGRVMESGVGGAQDISLSNTTVQTTGTGNITFTSNPFYAGAGGMETFGGVTTISSGGNFTYIGNILPPSSTTPVITAANDIIIRPYTAGTTVGIGTGVGTLYITDAWLGILGYGNNLWLGGYGNPGDAGYISNAGNLTIAETRSFAKNINFLSAGNILSSGSGTVTTTGAGNILLAALGDINLSSAQNFTASGTGSITERANGNIIHSGGGVDTTNGGAITLNADRDGDGNGAIALSSGSNLLSNGGSITLGGGADPLTGYAIGNGANPKGIKLLSNVSVQAAGGNILMHGQGWNSSSCPDAGGCNGIDIRATSSVGTTGNGTISLYGIIGSAVTNSQGAIGVDSSTVSTVNGDLSINGTNNETINNGYNSTISFGNATIRTTGTGNLHLISQAAAAGVGYVSYSNNQVISGGNIVYLGNAYNGVGGTWNAANDIVLRPYSAGTTVGIGSGAGTLSISDASLATLSWGNNLWLGGYGNPGDAGYISNAGNMTINETRSFAKNINFLSAGNILSSGTGTVTTTGAGNILLAALGNITLTTAQGFTAAGTGSITERANGNITASGNANRLTTNTGSITINADRDADGSGAINLISGSNLVTGGGAITLGGGINPLTDYARGNSAQGSGVYFGANATANGGDITINGQGWADITCNGNCMGTFFNNAAPILSTTGSGRIIVAGIAGGLTSTTNDSGVQLNGATFTTQNGDITITGTSFETALGSGDGIALGAASVQTTGTGNINLTITNTLTGVGGIGGYAVSTLNSGGNITYVGNNFDSTRTLLNWTAAGDIILRPYTAGTTIGIGSGSGTLNISDTLLSKLTWGSNLWLGGYGNPGDAGYISNAGNMTIAETRSFAKNINFLSAGNIGTGAGTVTTTGTGNILFAALGDVVLGGAHNFTASGSGSITERANNNINNANTLTTNGGAIILNADRDASGSGAISIANAKTYATNGGNIILGGGLDPMVGYAVGNATFRNGINIGSLTLNAGGGNILINGQGWTDATCSNNCFGVNAGGNTITTTGVGQIAINGIGGGLGATQFNSGINITSASTITAQNGDITMTGKVTDTGGGGNAFGANGLTLSTTGTGNISLIDTTPATTAGVLFYNSASMITAGGNVSIISNTLGNQGTYPTITAGNDIIIRPYSAGKTVGIGNGAGTLSINDTFLSKLNWGNNLWLGGYGNPGDAGYVSNAGNLSIQETRSFAKNINFLTAGNILSSSTWTLTTTGAGNILLAALGDINISSAQNFTASGTGTITARADNNIFLSGNTALLTQGGAITLNADRDASGSGGISINGATLTSNGGAITLGGGATPATVSAIANAASGVGVYINNATLNAGGGNISIRGAGSASAGSGLSTGGGLSYIQTNASGNINIYDTGVSGNAGQLYGTTFSTVNGDINFYVNGTSNGVRFSDNNIFRVTGTGNILLDASAIGGTLGLYFCNYSSCSTTNSNTSLATTSGSITLKGGIGQGINNIVSIGDAGTTGNINLVMNDLNVGNAFSVRTSGDIIARPLTAGTTVGIGSGAGALNLSDVFLGNLTWGSNLWLGGYGNPGDAGYVSNAGNMTIAETRSFAKNINFLSAGNIFSSGTGTITTTSAGNILLAALGEINLSSLQKFTASGSGSITERANTNIIHSGGGLDTTNGGTITLNADRDANGSGIINLVSASNLFSNGGAITLGGGIDPLTVMAVGYDATHKIAINSGATINAGGGIITLNGQGWNDVTCNNNCYGINLAGATFVTTGNGTILFNGTGGGTTGAYNSGIKSTGGASLSAQNGNIVLTARGTDASLNNFDVVGISVSTTGTGDITLDAGTGILGFFGSSAFVSGRNLTLLSDKSTYLGGTASFTAANDLIVRNYTAGKTIGIGSGAGTINLSDDTLSRFTWGNNLWLGGYGNPGDAGYISNAGNLTINETRSFAKNINFLSAGNILSSGSGTVTTTGAASILLAALGDINVGGAQNFTASGTGSITERANGNILAGGTLITQGGGITINSDRDADGVGAIVWDYNSGNVTSNGGTIILGGGGIPLTGYARGTSANPSGLNINSRTLNAGGGNIVINGQGWGNVSCNNNCYGANISSSAALLTLGSGTITINGLGGGTTGGYNSGFKSTGGLTITAVNGDITFNVNSQDNGGSDADFGYSNAPVITTTGTGNINFIASRLNNGGIGFNYATVNSGNNINFITNKFGVNQVATFTAANDIIFRPYTAGTTIGIGTGVGTLSVNDAALGSLTYGGNLWLGGYGNPGDAGYVSNAGNLTINETRSFAKNINFLSAGNILSSGTGTITTTGVGSILLAALGDINLSSAQNFTASGTGSITERANGNIIHSGGGVDTTNGGAITLNADRDANGTGGIGLSNASNLASNGGGIILGGGTTPSASGAWGNSAISAMLNAATFNAGILLSGTTLNAGSGALLLNGNGGTATGKYSGIFLTNGSLVQTTSGTITATGIGGAATGDNSGIFIGPTSGFTTASGTIALNGTGGSGSAGNNNGLYFYQGSVTSTGPGTISLVGNAGTGGINYGIYSSLATGSNIIGGGSDTGSIALIADTMGTYSNAALPTLQTTGQVTLRPYNGGSSIGIAGAAGALQLTSALLNKITAGSIVIGKTNNDHLITANAYNWSAPVTLVDKSFDIILNGLQSLSANQGFTATTATGGNIVLGAAGGVTTAGTGSIALSAANQILTTGASALTSAAGNIGLTATNGIALTYATPITSTSGNITFNSPLTSTASQSFNAGTGTISAGSMAVGGNNLTLTADDLALGGNLSGTGALTLQQSSANRAFYVNNGLPDGSNLNLSTTEIGYLVDGWSQINLGQNLTGTGYYVGNSTWKDPVIFNGGNGSKSLAGTITGQDNASIKASGAGGISLYGAIVTAGQAVIINSNASPYGATITTNGGSFSALYQTGLGTSGNGLTLSTSGGTIAFSGAVSGGVAGQGLNLNAGSGAISFGASVNGPFDITANAGGFTFNGAWGATAPLGNIALSSANTSFTLPNIAATGNVSLNAGSGFLTTGTIATGSGSLVMTADDVTIGGNLSGTGLLVLQPNSTSRLVNINNGAADGTNFHLSNAEIAYLADGWSGINIGRTDSNAYVNIGTSLWKDPTTFNGLLAKRIYGDLTGAGNAGFTFNGNTTEMQGGNIATAGGDVLMQSAALAVYADNATIITNGGAFNLGGVLKLGVAGNPLTLATGGGAITLASGIADISGNGSAKGINLAAGSGLLAIGGTVNGPIDLTASAGGITLGSAWGGTTPLGAVSLTSLSSLTLPSITASRLLARATGGTSDLTLASGTALSASGTGNALTLASGRNFVNNAGSGALALTGGGRWLIYSQDPSANLLGGLSAGFNRYSCAFSSAGACASGVVNVPGSGNGLLYGYTPGLTATPNAQNVTYGDAATLAGYAYTLSGYRAGDAGSDSVTGSLNGVSAYAPGSDIGTYALNYTSGALASALGYNVAYANNANAILVGTRNLTATLTGTVSKTYDGTTLATLASGNYALTNLYAPDAGSALLNNPASGTYDTKDHGTGKSISVTGLSLSGGKAGNYTLTSTSVSGTVGTILLKTLNAGLTGSVSKTYDTTDAATLGAGNYLLPGIVGSEAVTLNNPVNGTFDTIHVGTGKLVGVSGLSLSGADAGNYQLAASSISGNVGTVLAKILTAGLSGSVSKTYDTTDAATLSSAHYTLSPALGGDAVALNNPANGTYDTKHAGAGKTVSVTGLALTGANAADYQLAASTISGSVGTISAYGLTAGLTGTISKTYDTTNTATLGSANYTLSSPLGADVVTLNNPSSGAYDTMHIGTGKSVMVGGLALGGADAGDYMLTSNGISGQIGIILAYALQAGLTGTVSKSYDTTDAATLGGGNYTLSTVLGSDLVTLNRPTGGTYDTIHAGTGKNVSVSGLSLSGANAGDYLLVSTSATGAVGTILAKTLTAGLSGTISKTYDATDAATLAGSNYTLSGVLGSDAVTLVTPANAAYDDKNRGSGKLVTAQGLSLGGANAGDYALAATNISGTIGTILARQLTPSLTGSVSKTYDGTANATLDGSDYMLSGILGTEQVTLNNPAAGMYNDKNAANGKLVSVSGLALAGADAANYALSATSLSANIGVILPKALSVLGVTVNDKTYDGTMDATINAASAAFTGKVGMDAVGLNQGTLLARFLDPHAGVGKAVNISGFSLSGADMANYTLDTSSFTASAATIAQRATTASWTGSLSRVYGDENPTVSSAANFTYGNLAAGDTNASLTATADFSSLPATTNIGLYAVAASFASMDYHVTNLPATLLTITPRPLNVTTQNQTKIYGEIDPAITGTLSGLTADDAALTAWNYAPQAYQGHAGSYIIAASLADPQHRLDNYTRVDAYGTLTVTPRDLIAQVQDQSRLYGDANAPLSGQNVAWANFAAGDTVADIDQLDLAYAPSATPTAHAGTQHAITITRFADADYRLASGTDGTLSILQAPLTIRADDKGRLSGTPNPVFTAQYDGLKNREDISVVAGLRFDAPGDAAPLGAYDILPYGATANDYAIAYRPGTLSVTNGALPSTVEQGRIRIQISQSEQPLLTQTDPAFLLPLYLSARNMEPLLFAPISPVSSNGIPPWGPASNEDAPREPGQGGSDARKREGGSRAVSVSSGPRTLNYMLTFSPELQKILGY